MKKAVLILYVLLTGVALHAQYFTNQNKIWAFGRNYGVDFNSGAPVPISTNIFTDEGCASVCDVTGSLLFYSDGKKVYDKTGAVMPNGASIVTFSTVSTEQAALIVPVIGTTNQYYLFSLGEIGNGKLNYCIVDMSLDGGLGDVIASTIGTLLEDSLGENMIAVPGNSNNIWLITHRADTSLFLSYNITATGISAPIISSVGTFTGTFCYTYGMLRVSPNRRKIAQGIYGAASSHGVMLYDFAPNTGIISNCQQVDTGSIGVIGVEFSPDSKKLYANGWAKKMAYQYDIFLPTTSAIQLSKFIVTDSSYGGDMRLAPDGKIYFRGRTTRDLHCISKPNLAGVSCGFTSHAVIFTSIQNHLCFPNLFVTTDTTTYVESVEAEAPISLHPVPVTSELTVNAPTTIHNLSISNTIGQQVFWKECNTTSEHIDVSFLSSGVYFVKVNGVYSIKFIKQ